MDVNTILGASGIALISVSSGYLFHGFMAGATISAAIAEADAWRISFKQAASDLGKTCAERDEQRNRADWATKALEDTTAELNSARNRIAEMRPLYDLGVRRRAALDTQMKKDRDARRGDEDEMVQALLEEYPEGVTVAKVSEITGADSRRAGFLLRSVGAVPTNKAEGKTTRRVWIRPTVRQAAA